MKTRIHTVDALMILAMIACIIIGIAVDDTIHFVNRFKIEYEKEKSYPRALNKTLQSVGKAIIFTSLTLILGFLVFSISVTNSLSLFGLLASFSIFIALLADCFITPVCLLLFKPLK